MTTQQLSEQHSAISCALSAYVSGNHKRCTDATAQEFKRQMREVRSLLCGCPVEEIAAPAPTIHPKRPKAAPKAVGRPPGTCTEITEKDREVYQLRKEGATWPEIAGRYGETRESLQARYRRRVVRMEAGE